jgi:predicted aspartyl protease
MTRYPLQRVGRLLVTKAAVSGPAGVHVVRLLVDTGSVYTILPVEVLESIGCSPVSSHEHVRIITGSGYLIVPKVQIVWLQCGSLVISGVPNYLIFQANKAYPDRSR